MFRRLLIVLVAAAALLCGALAPVAYAQGGQSGSGSLSGLRDFIERVEREYARTSELARRSNDATALAYLSQAREYLDRAKMNAEAMHPVNSRRLAETALGLIQAAQQRLTSRQPGSSSNRAEQSIRSAEETLNRMERHGHDDRSVGLMRSMVDQAREAASEGRYDQAYRLSELAQEQGRRALQNENRSRMMERRTEILDGMVGPLVERAARLAEQGGNERMQRVAVRARERYAMARRLDSTTQGVQKVQLLEAAMREAEVVLRTLDSTGYERHRAERAIAEADAALTRAAAATEGEDGSTAETIARGRTLIDQARTKLAAGDSRAAENLADQGRRLARTVIRGALGSLTEENVAEAIGRTDRLIARAGNVRGDGGKQLLALARTRQQEARELLEAGRLRQALARTRIAARLAEQARESGR